MRSTKEKLMIGCFIIIFLISTIFVFSILHSVKIMSDKNDKIKNADNENSIVDDIANTPIENSESKTPMTYEERMGIDKDKENTINYTEDDLKKVQKEVIQGIREDVPDDMVQTKEELIREYIQECYEMEDIKKSIICFEDYYKNNDRDFIKGIEDCKDSGDCLDEFYYKFAASENDIFCHKITDEEIKKECMTTII